MNANNIKLFLLIVISSKMLFPQSAFKQRGENGFIAHPGISFKNKITKLELSLSYSYQGYLDFFLSFFKANGGDVKDMVIVPGVTYFLIKQEDANDIPSIGFVVGYSRYKYVSQVTVSIPESIAGSRDTLLMSERKLSSIRLGVTAHRKIGSWKQFFFQPFLDVTFSFHSEHWRSNIRCGILMGSKLKNGIQVFISPKLEAEASLYFLGIGMGIVF